MPSEKLKQLESEYKSIEDANKSLASDLKAANAGTPLVRRCIYPAERSLELAKLKTTPTDAELEAQVHTTAEKVRSLLHRSTLGDIRHWLTSWNVCCV